MEIIKLLALSRKNQDRNQKNHRYKNGIDETMSIDNCTHSFFGVSKAYADLIVKMEKRRFKNSLFQSGITGPNHSSAKYMVFYLT